MRSLARARSANVFSGAALALALTVTLTGASNAFAQSEPADEPEAVAVASPPAQLSAASAAADPAVAAPADPGQHPPSHGAMARRARRPVDPDSEDGPPFKEYLRLHAGPLTIEPVVLLQVQGIPYVGKDTYLLAGDPAERGGFRLRRARFGFEGRLFHRVPFAVNAQFDAEFPGTAQLNEAWFGYDRYKFLQIIAGVHTVPFSRTAIMNAGSLALIDRPFAVRALAPFNQLGVHIEGHLWGGALNYFAGVYNGLQRTDQFFTGYIPNPAVLGNRFDGLTYSGRLSSEPLGNMGRTMEDLHHSKFRIAAAASTFYSDGGTRGILGLGGDILVHWQGLHVLGEFLANRSTPKAIPTQPTTQSATVTSYAVVGEVGYVVLKERLGLTARFEWLESNTAVKDESDSWVVTGGLSYHVLHDFLKAQIEYSHRQELHGKSLQNDSVVIQAQLHL